MAKVSTTRFTQKPCQQWLRKEVALPWAFLGSRLQACKLCIQTPHVEGTLHRNQSSSNNGDGKSIDAKTHTDTLLRMSREGGCTSVSSQDTCRGKTGDYPGSLEPVQHRVIKLSITLVVLVTTDDVLAVKCLDQSASIQHQSERQYTKTCSCSARTMSSQCCSQCLRAGGTKILHHTGTTAATMKKQSKIFART